MCFGRTNVRCSFVIIPTTSPLYTGLGGTYSTFVCVFIIVCCGCVEEQRRDRMMRDFMMGRLRGSKMGGPMAARMREMMPFMHPRRMPPSFFMRHMEEEFMGRIPHELLMEGLMFGEFGGMGGPMDDDDEEQEGQDGEKETEEEENHDIIKENTYNQQDQMHYTSKLECYVGLLAYLLPPDLTVH